MPIDNHVVAMKRRMLAQIRHRYQATRILAQQAPIGHRHHQQSAIRQPAEPGWLSRHIEHRDCLAICTDITHFMGVEIREPKPVIVPPRCFREGKTIYYNPGRKRIFH